MDGLTNSLLYSIAIPVFITLATGIVLLYLNVYLSKFKKVFKVNKRISKLTPEDFGMHPGNPRLEAMAKFKASYIKRNNDGLIEKALNNNRAVLVLGRPKMGKTRAVYEAVGKYKKWYIIRPKDERIDVDSIKFPLFFRLRKVILFFDDLEKFADRNTEDFVKVIERRCKNVMILTTCRSGKEFGIIEGNKDLEYLFGECGKNQIELEEISNEQGISIAKTLGIKFDKNEFDNTPGSVALGIGDMKRRYHELPNIPKAIIRALKLLREGNIYNWPEDFVRNILKSKIFRIDFSSSDWNTALYNLNSQGLAFAGKGTINISHDSYLGETFIDDFPIENNLLIELRDTLLDLKDAKNLFYLANGFYYRKELEQSVDCLKFSIEINPDYTDAHYNLGVLLTNLQRYPEAESAYREAIGIEPDYAGAHNNLGVLLDDLQRYPEAESAYHEAIRIMPDYAEAHYNLGVLLYNLQRYPEAESAYREAIRINPDYDVAHYNMGI
ncbi:MAG: tetratricopeptide repeat protein, partial [candidate division Zixibacteria bacterium]